MSCSVECHCAREATSVGGKCSTTRFNDVAQFSINPSSYIVTNMYYPESTNAIPGEQLTKMW